MSETGLGELFFKQVDAALAKNPTEGGVDRHAAITAAPEHGDVRTPAGLKAPEAGTQEATVETRTGSGETRPSTNSDDAYAEHRMDESVQRSLEAAGDKTPMREHWVWINGRRTGTRCMWCDGRFPQGRDMCLRMHPEDLAEGAGEARLFLEPIA
jgi:hypothetical protein